MVASFSALLPEGVSNSRLFPAAQLELCKNDPMGAAKASLPSQPCSHVAFGLPFVVLGFRRGKK